ncbi:MAG TPA: metal-dependent transcriptional regulator [Chitinophagaceae bacterium]|nr:metal-dependent transcriptional regulator [Chitinophagaceae bacterium]
MKLSPSEENYVKSIYNLQLKTGKVNTNSLAALLDTTAASTTDMLKRLKSKNLLEYKKYYGFRLNSAGNKYALKIIRKHRLWEFFLVSKLNMEWEKVHDIAEELEHVSSAELIEKLDNFLGNPTIDPHGDPIPDGKGVMPVMNQIALKDLPLKKSGTVSSVSNQSRKMMEMLNHYRIKIGASIRVLKTFDFDGSLQVKIGKQAECVISGMAAQNIFVYDN